MDSNPPPPPPPPPIYRLPQDTLHIIFSSLSLRQLVLCRAVSKFFLQTLTSSSFLLLHPPLSLLSLRHSLSSSSSYLHAFDPSSDQWLRFPLSFLPFHSLSPVTSSLGLVYFWGETPSCKSLLVCNPLTRCYRVLPQLGSAWSKHGSVLAGSGKRVLVLSELATLYFNGGSGSNCRNWMKFSSNLPSKPRSPILISDSLFALCDVGSPWRSQWKLYACRLPENGKSLGWVRLEKCEWGDVFDILKRPRLVRGLGNKILMVGGLKSSFSLNATCSTILILRLDLDSLEWDEAGRMPADMYKCFHDSGKFKVFGGRDRVCFSAKRVGKLALWDCSVEGATEGVWRWIDGAPGFADGLCRGFVFDARLDAVP